MLPRGYIFIGLNAVRVLSIISLMLVFASSIFVMVTDVEAVNEFQSAKQVGKNVTSELILNCDYIAGSTVPNQAAGVFWAIINRLFIIFQVIILFLSEIGWPIAFFERFFPVLGPTFGLGALGIFQCLIGAAILSHHVDDFSLVSAFFLFALGCLNILLGLIFRERAKGKRSITQWRSDSKPILPNVRDLKPGKSSGSLYTTGSEKQEFDSWKSGGSLEKGGYGFGRQGEKAAGLKGFVISKPIESLPRYVTRPASESVYSQPSPQNTPKIPVRAF
jgi:hypothetical protein